jgi:hypothetical protein
MSAMPADNRSEEATAVVDEPPSGRKRVVIVGGGFAGLAAGVSEFLCVRRFSLTHHWVNDL